MIKLFEDFSNVEDVKETLFNYAVETYNTDLVDFFLNRGYDIDTDDSLQLAMKNDKMFRHMLKKGADVELLYIDSRLRDINIQKALIDYDHAMFIHKNIEFNSRLSDDPKYANVIEMVKNMEKYNL